MPDAGREVGGLLNLNLPMRFLDKTFSAGRFGSLLFVAAFGSQAQAAPGDVDPSFPQVVANAEILSAVVQPDRKILFSGSFTLINNTTTRLRVARLNANYSLDTGFDPRVTGTVTAINTLGNGSFFLGGGFTFANYQMSTQANRDGLAKFNSGGFVDTSFVPPAFTGSTFRTINTVVEQYLGGPLLTGSNKGVHRLRTDGSEDSTFHPYPYPAVTNVTPQPDLKILMAGGFVTTLPPAVQRNYLERLVITGTNTEDTTFKKNVSVNGEIQALSLLPDGKILIAGTFHNISIPKVPPPGVDVIPQRAIARLNADGTLDKSFVVEVSGQSLSDPSFPITPAIIATSVQADGKILIGGNFTTVTSTTNKITTTLERPGLARLNADGSVDPSFVGKPYSLVRGITPQGDGSLILTGYYYPGGAVTNARRIWKVLNDAPMNDLRASDSTTVRWLQGGSSPQAQSVVFESSFDGNSWAPLHPLGSSTATGVGTRIPGGWTITTAFPLTSPCQLRVRATVTGGQYNGSRGFAFVQSKYPIPQISAAGPNGTNTANGGTITLNPAAITLPQNTSIAVKNIGTGNLNPSVASLSGQGAASFSIVSGPSSPVGGPTGSTPLVIRFSPTSMGTKTATLTIPSNDETFPLYTVTLTANVVSEQEAWRSQYFGTTAGVGDAADDADPDGDGQNNLFEYVAGLLPKDATSKFNQRVENAAGIAKLVFSPRLEDRTYEVQTSTTLAADWATANGTTSDNLLERTFTDGSPYHSNRFYRVKIIKP